MRRHNDPHKVNLLCNRQFEPGEGNLAPCGQCGDAAYSCVCGAIVDGRGVKHRCAVDVASVEHYDRLSEVARRDYRARAVGLNPQTMTELARIDAGLKARCLS
jgi:hypothetical protein